MQVTSRGWHCSLPQHALECSPHLSCSSLDITELKTLKGLALHDILTEVHLFVHRGNWGREEASLGWLQRVRSVLLSRNRKRVTDL